MGEEIFFGLCLCRVAHVVNTVDAFILSQYFAWSHLDDDDDDDTLYRASVRHYAEFAGYWTSTEFLQFVKDNPDGEIEFFDSVTGELLFTAPRGRTMKEFLMESQSHGWPSFRDEEVNWDYVRVLKDGECVSTTGTHLGHDIPDKTGHRYCINLVSVAGQPQEKK